MKLSPGSLDIVCYLNADGAWVEKHLSTLTPPELLQLVGNTPPADMADVLANLLGVLEKFSVWANDTQRFMDVMSEPVVTVQKREFQSRGHGLAGFGPVGERDDKPEPEDA